MNEVNVNVIAANRKPISMLGANLGTMYFQAEARASIADFEQKQHEVVANNNIELILNRTPRRYRMVGNDIVSVMVGTDATGATKVFLNKDNENEVSIPVGVGMEKIGVITDDALGKALRGDKSVIFSNAEKLAQQLNMFNMDEKKRLLEIRSVVDKCISQLDSTVAENNKKVEEYKRELIASTPSNIPGATSGDGVVVVTE